jgi:hypothetical protein
MTAELKVMRFMDQIRTRPVLANLRMLLPMMQLQPADDLVAMADELVSAWVASCEEAA